MTMSREEQIAVMVENLGEEIYPVDVFPKLTDEDKANLKVVEHCFPNLLSRVDTAACWRAFNIAGERIREMEEED